MPSSMASTTTLRTKGLVGEYRSFIFAISQNELFEIVLAAPDFAEHLGGGGTPPVDGGGKVRIVGAQERIGRALVSHGGGNGELPLRAQLRHFRLALAQGGVVGVDADGKAGIGGGIFMAAKDARFARQLAQLVEGGPHHRRRAFEHASA